jgi:hypothetical protein
MQKTKALLLLVLVMFLTSVAFSQTTEKRLWMATEIIIKSDQIQNYEASLKEVVKLFKEHEFPYSFSVFRSGGFSYYMFFKLKSLEEWDQILSKAYSTWDKIDPALFEKYRNCIQSYKRFTISDIPELNYSPASQRISQDEMNYAIWDVMYVEMGKEVAFMKEAKKFMELANQNEFGDPVLMLQGGIGADNPVYFGVLYGKDDIDMRQENRKLWKSFGEEGSKMYQNILSTLRHREMIEFWFRRDLSLSNE